MNDALKEIYYVRLKNKSRNFYLYVAWVGNIEDINYCNYLTKQLEKANE